ncbi:MAG: cysteine--tRNA ligase [Candidatus Aenigmatarchaeota archaeon]|nr:MAG: cysteine--tRNA ligase [Candidatus Aenigmarchaeota archaeon]
MVLRFYNTLTRKKEEFRPQSGNEVRMYSCGPTVYDYAHIGNFRAYVATDIIRRYLKYRGFKLKHIMNITDVDDKTIRNSREQGMPLSKYTEKYTKIFFEDLDTLNIERVERYPKATDHINEMVDIVGALLRKGYAYKGKDAIYFSISKFPSYGELAHLEKAQLKAGARVKNDEYDKEHAHDFALWKLWDKDDGDVFWETSIGKGRPGWHIECSAMSMKYLGPTLDIHTGGVDLIFPHHQNEIAQSEGATGKQFVRYWMHNEHLMVDGQKMSKSRGNFYTLRDLLKGKGGPDKPGNTAKPSGHDPMAIRYLLLASHYRQKLNMTGEALKSAKQAVDRLREFVSNARDGEDGEGIEGIAKKAKEGFEKAMDDDLNTPEALSVVFDFVREANKAGAGSRALEQMMDFDKVLGLRLSETGEWKKPEDAPEEIRKLILDREERRKQKDWEGADKIRDKLGGMGIILEDTEDGPRWKKTT